MPDERDRPKNYYAKRAKRPARPAPAIWTACELAAPVGVDEAPAPVDSVPVATASVPEATVEATELIALDAAFVAAASTGAVLR